MSGDGCRCTSAAIAYHYYIALQFFFIFHMTFSHPSLLEY